jgi:hypothetical protein
MKAETGAPHHHTLLPKISLVGIPKHFCSQLCHALLAESYLTMMDHNATDRETHCICATEEEPELGQFGSNHAVDPRDPEGLELGSSSAPIKHLTVLHRSRTKSILLGDVFSTRRVSCITGSTVSSMTMPNFEESFFSNDGSQEWDFPIISKEGEEHVYCCIDTACLHADTDLKPICPRRRGSKSLCMEKISCTPRQHDAEPQRHYHGHDHPIKESCRLTTLARRTSSELPPVKPGRRDSTVSADPLSDALHCDSSPTMPGRHESMATFFAEDVPGIEQPTDEETTTSATSSTHSPYFHRSKGKRSFFRELQTASVEI